jgi:glycosyltransferase involved in cell wall biosynthesis
MLNVLHVVGDSVGGIRKHVHDVIFGLNDEFNFFYICSTKIDETFKKDFSEISRFTVDFMQLNIVKKPALSDIYNIIRILYFVKKNKINIIHGHGAKGGLYARIVGMFTNVKVCYTPHGGIVHSMFNRYEEFLYSKVEKFLIPRTTQFIFESLYTKNNFYKKFKVKKDLNFIVNYNGVDFDEVRNSDVVHKMDDHLIIGFFGMLREEKGVFLSIDVIEKISKSLNVKYYIYGDGPLKDAAEKLIQDRNLSDIIFLKGYVTDVLDAMQNVDIVFLPSLFESFGYVAVEAMYLKKPLVCSDAGGLPEVVGPSYPFLFSSGSVSDAYEKINRINASMKLTAFKEELSSYAEKSKVKFSKGNMLTKLADCYNNI